MRITDPEVIRNGEKDLLKALEEDLDLGMVKEILQKQMAAFNFNATGGQIVVHDNQIAFKLDYTIQLSGSLMFDRDGNYIPGTQETEQEDSSPPDSDNFDLDDLDLQETLEEVAPQKSPAAPDAGEAGEPYPELTSPDLTPLDALGEPDDQNDAEENHDQDFGEPALDIKLPEYDSDKNALDEKDLDNVTPENENLEDEEDQLPDMPEPLDMPEDALQNDEEDEDDLIDDDISDILKESREFWDQKKDI